MTSHKGARGALAVACAALLALPLIALGAVPVEAQTTVSTPQQLRDAIGTAQSGDTIVLGGNILLDCPDDADSALTITGNITLSGGTGTMRQLSLPTNATCRIIEHSGGTLTINNLHLTGGRAPNGENEATDPEINGGDGGAILSTGAVTVTASHFSNNRAGDGGVGLDNSEEAGEPGGEGGTGGNGGAIAATGTVTVTNSTFDTNRAGNGGKGGDGGKGAGGADHGDGGPGPGEPGSRGGDGGHGGDGGAIHTSGTASITRSTFNGNEAGAGGDGGDGGEGGKGGDGDDDADPTPIEGGVAGGGGHPGGGGDAGSGGAIAASTVTSNTSTIHANSLNDPGIAGQPGEAGEHGENPPTDPSAVEPDGTAGEAGEQGTGGATFSTGNTTATSSTITENKAGSGADDDLARSIEANSIALNHTVVFGEGPGSDCVGDVPNPAHSVDGDASCIDGTPPSNLWLHGLGTGDGDPTPTRLPRENSPLVDAGAATCPQDTDQRSISRPQGPCDIGAVERRGPVKATITAQSDAVEGPAGQNLEVVFTLAFSNDSSGIVEEDELTITSEKCPNPTRGGDGAPWTGGDKVTFRCVFTSDKADNFMVRLEARWPDGEAGPRSGVGSDSAFVVFLAAPTSSTTTTVIEATTIPPIQSDVGGAGGSSLPRTGLSILLTLAAGAVMVFGGTSMSKVAKARAEKSPRWNVKYGVPYPAGTHKQRTRDDI